MIKFKLTDLISSNDGINFFLKKCAHTLLKTPLFTKNPVYEKLYYKNVERKIPEITKNIDTVLIEPTNYCNIDCYFCPYVEMERPKGVMSFDLYKSIIDDCAKESVQKLLLYGLGEPLIDKNYFEKIRYAKDKGIPYIECTTNGILMNKDRAEALVDSGLTALQISIDAASAKTYHDIHGKDDFDTILENIIYLMEYRKRVGKTYPIVTVRFRMVPPPANQSNENSNGTSNSTDPKPARETINAPNGASNLHEIKPFRKLFGPLVDHIKLDLNVFSWPGSSFEGPMGKSQDLVKFPCRNLWTQIYISHDGKVGLCCLDYEFRDVLGDVTKQGLREIWNGELFQNKRKLHLEGKFESIPLCNDCTLNTQMMHPWWI